MEEIKLKCMDFFPHFFCPLIWIWPWIKVARNAFSQPLAKAILFSDSGEQTVSFSNEIWLRPLFSGKFLSLETHTGAGALLRPDTQPTTTPMMSVGEVLSRIRSNGDRSLSLTLNLLLKAPVCSHRSISRPDCSITVAFSRCFPPIGKSKFVFFVCEQEYSWEFKRPLSIQLKVYH